MAKSSKKPKGIMDTARESFDSMRDATRESSRRRSAQLALHAVELQRKTFDGAIDGIGKLQEQSAKMLHNLAKNSEWVPKEGKEAVDEWIDVSKKGRQEFKKSMDKSFDLLSRYFKRLESGTAKKGTATKGKSSGKKSGTKKTKAKKKSGAKRKSATKKKKTSGS